MTDTGQSAAALQSPAPVQGDRGELIAKLRLLAMKDDGYWHKGQYFSDRCETESRAADALTADAALIAAKDAEIERLRTAIEDAACSAYHSGYREGHEDRGRYGGFDAGTMREGFAQWKADNPSLLKEQG